MIALRDRRVEKVEAFLALAGVSPAGEILAADETRLVQRFLPVAEDDNHALVVRVPNDSILWPGSGVVRCGAADEVLGVQVALRRVMRRQ